MNNKRFDRPFCLTVEEAAEQARVGLNKFVNGLKILISHL